MVKPLLFLILAVIIGVSTYDYATSSEHYGPVVAVGVIAALLLADKAIG